MKVYVYEKKGKPKKCVALITGVLCIDFDFDVWRITTLNETIEFDNHKYMISVFGY